MKGEEISFDLFEWLKTRYAFPPSACYKDIERHRLHLAAGIPAGFSSLQVKASAMEKKNPLPAALFNMLVPGSGYWYVDQDRGRFIKTLITGVFIQNLL